MKVFISWSGERSRKLAEFLAGWLKKLPLAIEPWVSKDAIDPGTRWGKELAEALEGTSFGILCITSENQREPWISFEAGALSKTIEKSYVIPYLIGMKPSELEQPLKQFQAIEATAEGTWKLIETIHMASGDKTRTINDLEEAFRMWWPKLSEQIENVKNEVVESINVTQEPSMSDIQFSLDKVLTVMESLSSRFTRLESERFVQTQTGGFREPKLDLMKIRNIIKTQIEDDELGEFIVRKLSLNDISNIVKSYYIEPRIIEKYYDQLQKEKSDKQAGYDKKESND